jgi:hypothetical protein
MVMRLEITPNFISDSDCEFLNAWVYEGIDKKWLDNGLCTGKVTNKRFTSRMYGYRYKYPAKAIEISEKIRKFVGINNYSIIDNHGKNGIVVSYTKPEGDVYKHKDPKLNGMSALRCNIMTQEADYGAELFVDEKKVNVNVGDLHCYLASDFEHYVTEIKGNTPRILWMFGAYVPKQDWEDGKIKYGLS